MKKKNGNRSYRYALLAAGLCYLSACGGESRDKTGQPKFEALEKASKEYIAEADGNLTEWRLLGAGKLVFNEDENAFMLSETQGSVGVTLVSPEIYSGDVSVTFMAKPVTNASVNVVMINASDMRTGMDFSVPADHDGSFGFWTEGTVQSYVFAFHNAAHNRLPFIVKCPGMDPIAEGKKHHMEPGRWQKVEISRKGTVLSLKVNGITVVEGKDRNPGKELPGGRICFRLRGTPDSLASCLFKSVAITEY